MEPGPSRSYENSVMWALASPKKRGANQGQVVNESISIKGAESTNTNTKHSNDYI